MTEDTAVVEHGIIMQAHSVRSILDGTKTQTRRVVTRGNSYLDGCKVSKERWADLDFTSPRIFVDPGPSPSGNPGPYLKVPDPTRESVHRIYPRWQRGDHLWVLEAWQYARQQFCRCPQGAEPSPCDDWTEGTGCKWDRGDIVYAADGTTAPRWRSPFHMSRELSRITLEITEVRVEQVQSISEADALAEGIPRVEPKPEEIASGECTAQDVVYLAPGVRQGWGLTREMRDQAKWAPTARDAYRILWDSINAKHPWDSNPWVFAFTFRRV